jgi:hypothetical protein
MDSSANLRHVRRASERNRNDVTGAAEHKKARNDLHLKQRAIHELEEGAILASYLTLFFGALATYSMLVLNEFHISYFAYGTALINALIVTKVILVGDAVGAGTKFESKSLISSAIWKAFVFACLVMAVHLLEEAIKALLHNGTMSGALHDIRIQDPVIRTLLVFCTFIPLFVLRELRRVMGWDRFRGLFLQSASPPNASATDY